MPKITSSTQGLYRSMSQFDSDANVPAMEPRQNRAEPSIRSVPTSPQSIATSNDGGIGRTKIAKGNGVTARSDSDEDPESPEAAINIPRHLPRESIEIMRGGSAEDSPNKLAARSKKADFKKKKARAPLPRTGSGNASDDNRRFVSADRGINSDGAEMDI